MSLNLKRYFWPRSLLSRTLLLTVLSVFLAQGIATVFWYTQSKEREIEGLNFAAESMGNMFATTTTFFQTLPIEYREIALEQLRSMGGARFFVSFNKEEILINPIPQNDAKSEAIATLLKVLKNKLHNIEQIKIEFSYRENLNVLNNNVLLSDLPRSWAHNTLNLGPPSAPILVVQIELTKGQWIYIAAILPAPYLVLENALIHADQLVFLVAITTLLLFFTFTLIRNQTRPLKRLAQAANRLSADIEQPELLKEGASEITTVTHAFNLMQKRIQRYMHDREKLFGSISHDLKTPITRLRLRAELIDDEIQTAKMNQDLDELEMMVKGALQTVKDTDIHENVTQIDVFHILSSIAEVHNHEDLRVRLRGPQNIRFRCKPLAFKRCLTNLIDNAVKYGEKVIVYLYDNDHSLDITLLDEGPGIPEEYKTSVFEPYFRLHTDNHGTGLGLGIAKNIIHAHGGEIILSNRPHRGLQIDIVLPKVDQ